MFEESYDSGFDDDELQELRLRGHLQKLLSSDELKLLTDGRVYVTLDRRSLAINLSDGAVDSLQFGTHHFNEETEQEDFVGYEVTFADAGSDSKTALGTRRCNRPSVVEWTTDQKEIPESHLDSSLVELIERHIDDGQVLFFEADAKTHKLLSSYESKLKRCRFVQQFAYLDARYRTGGVTALFQESEHITRARTDIYSKAVQIHSDIQLGGMRERANRLLQTIGMLPLARMLVYRSAEHSDKLGS